MSKLFNLKEWVTFPEAAQHLSSTLEEDVSEVDLLRLGLEGHLTLSIYFVNKAFVKMGEKMPAEGVTFKDINLPTNSDETISIPNAIHVLGENEKEAFWLALEDEVYSIEGICDIPLIGEDQLLLKRRYHSLNDNIEFDRTCLEGAFVEGLDGTIYQIQDRFDDDHIKKMKERGDHNRNDEFYPGSIPDDSTLVVRTKALREFVSSLTGEKKQRKSKSAETNSQNTLLKLIITMAKDGYGYDHEALKSPVPKEISDAAIRLGFTLDSGTVRKWLKAGEEFIDIKPE